MHRRRFITTAAGGLVALPFASRWADAAVDAPSLPRLREVVPKDLILGAAPGRANLGAAGARPLDAWLYNDMLPGPVLRMRRGEEATITLRNGLPESSITHWHGLMVPEAADGHPRFAIASGAEYHYRFTVDQPAGLAWYHPHTHMRTGYQVHQGLAGLIVIDDPADRDAGLPDRDHEVLLVVQDRTIAEDGTLPFDLRGPAMMAGYFGDTLLVNGAAEPVSRVEATTYRLRLLNGSASRIYELAFPASVRTTVIGADIGSLPTATPVTSVTLAPAERVDLIVDFSAAARSTVTMETRAFDLPEGTFGPRGMGRGPSMMRGRQGDPGRLMQFIVGESPRVRAAMPRLASWELPPLPRGATERRFVFSSMMMDHTINRQSFEMARRDVVTRAGAVERWTLVNDGPVPHPVHLHAARFLVRERTGGRGRTFPWESGWKDTVLVLPSEVVTIDVHFAPHQGLFLLHCHNLVHEDMGMMLNVALE